MELDEAIKTLKKLVNEIIMNDDLNTFDELSPFEIATMINELLKRIDELENHIHYKKCVACGKEFKSKRKDAKYCVYCGKFENHRNYYLSLTEEQKQKRREQAKLSMRRLRSGNKANKESE